MINHLRLEHSNFLDLKRLFPSIFINKDVSSIQCNKCEFAKHTRSSYTANPYTPSQPLTMIYSDI